MREEEETRQIVYEVRMEGTEESAEKVKNVRAAAEGLREQVAALKEEPLAVAPEVKPPEKEEEEEKKKPVLPKKKLKPEEEAAVGRVSGMLSQGLVQGLKSGDVKSAMKDMGAELATQAATSVLSTVIQSALSFIPGVGPLLSGLFGGLKFQSEGLVRAPTLALLGERGERYVHVPAIC